MPANASLVLLPCFLHDWSDSGPSRKAIEVQARQYVSCFPLLNWSTTESSVCGKETASTPTRLWYDIETVLHGAGATVRAKIVLRMPRHLYKFPFRLWYIGRPGFTTSIHCSSFHFSMRHICGGKGDIVCNRNLFMYQVIIGLDNMFRVCAYFVFVVAQRDFTSAGLQGRWGGR